MDVVLFAGGDLGHGGDLKALVDEGFTLCFGGFVIVEEVKCVALGKFGVDAVAGKAAAQSVGTVMHGGDGTDDPIPGDPLSRAGKDPGNGAAGGNAHLTFSQHIITAFLWVRIEKRRS